LPDALPIYISHVINYDVPHTPEDYVHRIGRTGRLEAVGDAFTLMSPEEKSDVAAIERFLGRSIPRVLIPDFDYKRISDGESRSGGRGRERGGSGGRDRGGPASGGRRGPAREHDSHARRAPPGAGRRRPGRRTAATAP